MVPIMGALSGFQKYRSLLCPASEQGVSQLQCVDGWIMGDKACGSHRSGPQATNISQVKQFEMHVRRLRGIRLTHLR